MAYGVLGIVPARGGSKSIPGKNLRPCAGLPLICHTFNAAKQSRCLTRIIVTTDSEAIADCARENGVEVPFMRPAALAGDKTPMIDVVEHVVAALREKDAYEPDILVLLQPTAPLRRAEHIDEAVGRLCDTGMDSVVSVTPVPKDYHPEWQLRMDGDYLVTYAGEKLAAVATRRQDLGMTLSRNGAVYALWRTTLENYGDLYGRWAGSYLMSEEDSVNINEPNELQLAELRLLNRREHI